MIFPPLWSKRMIVAVLEIISNLVAHGSRWKWVGLSRPPGRSPAPGRSAKPGLSQAPVDPGLSLSPGSRPSSSRRAPSTPRAPAAAPAPIFAMSDPMPGFCGCGRFRNCWTCPYRPIHSIPGSRLRVLRPDLRQFRVGRRLDASGPLGRFAGEDGLDTA